MGIQLYVTVPDLSIHSVDYTENNKPKKLAFLWWTIVVAELVYM